MSLQNLSDYRNDDDLSSTATTGYSFPKADIPTSGNYTGTFGKEQRYYGDPSAAAEGEKTYSSGKYVFDPQTGKYTWIPAKATTADTTTKKDTVADVLESPAGGEKGAGNDVSDGFPGSTNVDGVSGPTTGIASLANSLAATLGNLGLTSLSDAIAKGVDPNYSHEGRATITDVDSQAALADAFANAMSGADAYADADSKAALADAFANAMSGADAYADADSKATQADAFANAMSGADAYAGPADGGDAPPGGGDVSEGGGDAPPGGGDVSEGGGDVSGGDVSGGDVSGGDVSGGDVSGGDQANGGMVGRYARGGLGSLGGYSDGGRLLRGPGDGVSDSIPATIGRKKQPARLADGEFVVPSRIVSELGNGSTEAGARKLYAMLARIQAGRSKSMGKNRVAVNSRMDKNLPA